MKVSVIVPIYNCEKYLANCLDSIVSQTLDETEIILENDGSTDGSLKIMCEYAKKYPNIIVVDKQNSGYGATMNCGIDAARGEYIAIVEPDDYIDKNMFSVLYKKAKKYDLDVIKSDYYEFSAANGCKRIKSVYNKLVYNRVINCDTCPNLFHYRMNTWTGLYKTDFIKSSNIRYNETPGASYQDNGFWFQTMALAKKIMFINKAFYHYRVDNPNSSINSKNKIYCMCDEYDYIENFLKKNDVMYEKFLNIFLAKKFDNYFYTFTRISDEYKLDFLKKFGEDFRLFANVSFMDKCKMLDLETIIENPALYIERYKNEDTFYQKEQNMSKFKKIIKKVKKYGFFSSLTHYFRKSIY